MPLVARWGSSFLRTITFLIIHRFLSLKVLLLIYCFSKSTAYNTFQLEKLFWIWWKVLDTIILWQDMGPCCEQTHAAFEVGLSLDQGQGVYSGWSGVVGSSQLRLCHTCILDVMIYGGIYDQLPNFNDLYSDVIMGVKSTQIKGVSIVYSTVCSGADQRKPQTSVSLSLVRRIHRWPVNSPHKGPVTRKMFPFDDVIMIAWHSSKHFRINKLPFERWVHRDNLLIVQCCRSFFVVISNKQYNPGD